MAGIVRDPDDQVPIRLGDPVQLAELSGGIGLAWLDDESVGVLSGDAEGSSILEQVVGGTGSTSSASAGMASIAGGTSLSSARLRATDGALYVKRGTGWRRRPRMCSCSRPSRARPSSVSSPAALPRAMISDARAQRLRHPAAPPHSRA
nr:hypothetical protein GCM10025699_20120 [Microbacterium flavescens]